MLTNLFWRCNYCDTNFKTKETVLKHILVDHKVNGEDPIMYSIVLISPKEARRLLGLQTSDKTCEKNTAIDNRTKKKKSKKAKVIKRTHYDFGRLANAFSNPDLVENDKNHNIAENAFIEQSSSDDKSLPSCASTSSYIDRTEICRFRTPFLNNHTKGTCNNDTNVTVTHDKEHDPSAVSVSEDSNATVRCSKRRIKPSKPPRGKCTDWQNCPQCTREENCGECRHCTDKSLQ